MDEREIRDILGLFGHFAEGLGVSPLEELEKMKKAAEDEMLTQSAKHLEHIFADTEVVGEKSKVEHLKGIIAGLSEERKRFQAKAKENYEEIARLREMHENAIRELAAITQEYHQLKVRYERMGELLEVNEEEQAQQKEDLKELEQLSKQVKAQQELVGTLKAAIVAIQAERDQFRQCVDAIRTGLGSVPKDSVKAKLEEFVSCVREAISKISA